MKSTMAVVIFGMLAAACASAAYKEEIARLAPQAEAPITPLGVLKIVDEQPIETSTFDLNIGTLGDCTAGVMRLGSKGAAHDRIARLEREIVAATGTMFKGEELRVLEYGVYINAATANREVGMAAAFGPLAAPPVAHNRETILLKPRCSAEKMADGWFDPADLENNKSPFVVEIEIILKEQKYTATAAYSPPFAWERPSVWGWNEPAPRAVVQAALNKANRRLVEAINSK